MMFGPKAPEGEREAPKSYKDFFAQHIAETNEGDYKITVYIPNGTGRQKGNMIYVDTYFNEIPDLKELGLLCGAVTLKFYGHRLSTNEKHYHTEHLHESWNQKKALHDKAIAEQTGGYMAGGNAMSSMKDLMYMLKELKDITGGNSQEDVYKSAMKSILDANAQILQDTLKTTNQIKLAALKKPAPEPEPVPAKDEDKIDWGPAIAEGISVVKQWGDQFLNAGPLKQYVMKQKMKTNPEVQAFKEAVQSDNEMLQALYDAALRDPDIGETKINKLMAAVGIEVDNGPPPAADQNSPTEGAPSQPESAQNA